MSNVPPPPPAASFGWPTSLGAVRYAGFLRRLAGSLLDALLYGLAFVPVGLVGGLLFAVGFNDCVVDPVTDELVCDGRENIPAIVGAIAVLGIGWLAILVVYLRSLAKKGQTWGRRIVGIRVVDVNTGRSPGWGRAIGRTLFAQVISGNFCFLGYLWMLWDGRKQTWHDKVASTAVVVVR